jgi:protein-arginine kinase activator protein McsA
MSVFKNLIGFLKKHKKQQTEESPENMCTNCWGRQQHGNKFYEMAKNEGIDINTPDKHSGWIKEYTDKYLVKIELKKNEEGLYCESCKITFKEE